MNVCENTAEELMETLLKWNCHFKANKINYKGEQNNVKV
jgi:hypothetical protein